MNLPLMIRTNASDRAVTEFRLILDAEPDNVEALLGAGVALVNVGYATGDRAQLREGLDVLRKFVEKAPEGHRAHASAIEALEFLARDVEARAVELDESQSGGNSPRSVEGGVINGRTISKPKPPYPAIAKAAFAQGTVVVRLVVNEQGDVVWARAVSGHPLLRAVAVAAAREAKFTPTLLDGKPVKVTARLLTTSSFSKGRAERSGRIKKSNYLLQSSSL